MPTYRALVVSPGLVACLTLAVAAPGQDPTPPRDPDLARLIGDLGDDERGIDAVRALARRGDAAVAELTAAIQDRAFRADSKRLAAAVYALGKLGDTAAPAAKLLVNELRTATGDVARNVYWTLGEIGPKAEADGARLLDALAAEPEPGWTYQEWAFACRRIEVGLAVGPAGLTGLLQLRDHASLIAAAGILRRGAPASAANIENLLAAWQYAHDGWRAYGDGWARVALELARAVALHAADTEAADAARAALVYHFDVEVRFDAVMQLGQRPGKHAAVAVRALQAALTDGSVLVRREAVTSLGMLGAEAIDAADNVAALVDHPDAQTRARAVAALRAIRRPGK